MDKDYQDYKYRLEITDTEVLVGKWVALPIGISIEQANQIHRSNNFNLEEAFDYWVSQGGEANYFVENANPNLVVDLECIGTDDISDISKYSFSSLPISLGEYDFSQPRPEWFSIWNNDTSQYSETPNLLLRTNHNVLFVEVVDNTNDYVLADYFWADYTGNTDARYWENSFRDSNYVEV